MDNSSWYITQNFNLYGFLKKYFDYFDYIITWVLLPVSNKAMFSLWIQDHIFGQESLTLVPTIKQLLIFLFANYSTKKSGFSVIGPQTYS